MTRRTPRLLTPALFVGLTWALGGCGGSADPADPGSTSTGGEWAHAPLTQAQLDALLARERAAHHAAKAEWTRARTEFAPLVAAGAQPSPDDLARAALIELQAYEVSAARDYVARALEAEPDHLAALYLKGRIASLDFDTMGEAEEIYRRLAELAPDDLATRYVLGRALEEQDPDSDAEYDANQAEAVQLYESILDAGLEHGGSWYVSAAFRLYTQALQGDDEEARTRATARWKALEEIGGVAVGEPVMNAGELARLTPPVPAGNTAETQATAPVYSLADTVAAEFAGADWIQLHDLDGNRRLDVLGSSGAGVFAAMQDDAGAFAVTRLSETPGTAAAALDLDRDDTWELVLAQGNQLVLVEHGEAGFAAPKSVAELGGDIDDLCTVDFDHDGDLDLVCAGSFGLRLLRNDGVGRLPEALAAAEAEGASPAPRGAFVDATEAAGLDLAGPFVWCAIEDVDEDRDVDLLAGGPARTLIASSLRGGRFEDATSALLGAVQLPRAPAIADLDGDGRTDLFVPGAAESQLLLQTGDGRFVASPLDAKVPAGSRPTVQDLDQDMLPDVVWAQTGFALAGVLAVANPSARAGFTLAEAGGSGPVDVGELDLSRDTTIAQEVVRAGPAGLEIWRTASQVGNAVRLKYIGKKDNRQGIGAVVELRAGPRYRRIFWDGDELVVGVDDAEYVDVARVTWPNGVTSSELDLDLGDQFFLAEGEFGEQPEGLIGSCPFLYTWNGETFTFISDVLGATPLGLPMAPGMLVPPDHDEYVLVRGDQLVPRDGFFELQFTEELREVTYLDRARLEVIDHPIGSRIYPDERFCFPPFPESHVHTVEGALPPVRATGSDGEDWTAELAEIDDEHARPFVPYRGQFLGLADSHWLELEFDAEAVAAADRLRLVCTGWFYWSDASVNMAAARTPGVDFVPPTILVPGEDGSWVPAGPPPGFPAGKTKTMVLDLDGVLNPLDPRIRLTSTLALYWDAIELAVCADDAEQIVQSLEVADAVLWPRGFSKATPSGREDLPERFDWNEVESRPRWPQHPGMYTRYGDTSPLLGEVDDRFAILGSGDCLTLRFDASSLDPVPAGYTRDYLVFLDGWAKDRDPNTIDALEVEPLPFHGMSGYPYGPDESFPDTPAHRAWRQEWNTRPARQDLAPLAPGALKAWLEAQG